MKQEVTLLPGGERLWAEPGTNLLELLRRAGHAPEAPCGGRGTCGKCRVVVEGREALACRTTVNRNLTVELPQKTTASILSGGETPSEAADPEITGNLLAIDLGTTTMVCYLLDPAGKELAATSGLNPQRSYGADVISRIQSALKGHQHSLCASVREGLSRLIEAVCRQAGVSGSSIQRIALVANPCMQQLLLDISPENLAQVPFSPAVTRLKILPAQPIFPSCPGAELVVVPSLSGYVGSDTIGCILSTELYKKDSITLMVDIGTNGEMVLGNRHRMIACSTAAGPALEGAGIRFGMGGAPGAIDHVTWEEGHPKVHAIGGGKPLGICGSGLIDAVAGMGKQGLLNHRGRIQSGQHLFEGDRAFPLTEEIYLTQQDIRQVQLAKGAIAAGIQLMARQLGIGLEEVDQVLLAGAFGSFINPESACAIGLLPPVLLPRIRAVGNAAGSGAKLLCLSREQQRLAEKLTKDVEFLELASLPDFQRAFAKHTHFCWEDE